MSVCLSCLLSMVYFHVYYNVLFFPDSACFLFRQVLAACVAGFLPHMSSHPCFYLVWPVGGVWWGLWLAILKWPVEVATVYPVFQTHSASLTHSKAVEYHRLNIISYLSNFFEFGIRVATYEKRSYMSINECARSFYGQFNGTFAVIEAPVYYFNFSYNKIQFSNDLYIVSTIRSLYV